MTKSSGSKQFDGFSLIEVLLVLALVGVITGLVSGNVGAFITGAQFEPPDRVLKKAILDAIYESTESKRSTFLSFDKELASFRISNDSGAEINLHPIYKEGLSDEREVPDVRFQAIGPQSGSDGGTTIYDEDELVLTRVPFHYGSSVPFKVEIDFMENLTLLQFDPFSGFVLKAQE